MITLELPVSKPIEKFLFFEFGENYQPTNTDWLGILILQTLEKKTATDYYQYKRKNDAMQINASFPIHLSASQIERFGIILSKSRINLLTKAIDDVFRKNIYKQALLNKEFYDINYKESILNCLEFYGISEGEKSYYQRLMRDFSRKTTDFKSLKN